jgi:hypothetical protein
MRYLLNFSSGFAAGFALAWWYRPKWMVARLKRYLAENPE